MYGSTMSKGMQTTRILSCNFDTAAVSIPLGAVVDTFQCVPVRPSIGSPVVNG